MSRRQVISCVLGILCLLVTGCNWVPGPEEARKRLVGKYELFLSNDCSDKGLAKDTLELREDGTYIHEVILNNGETFREQHPQWEYSEGSLFLENYRDFTGNRSPGSAPSEAGGSFVLEFGIGFSNDPNILLHPDLNCVYMKEGQK